MIFSQTKTKLVFPKFALFNVFTDDIRVVSCNHIVFCRSTLLYEYLYMYSIIAVLLVSTLALT